MKYLFVFIIAVFILLPGKGNAQHLLTKDSLMMALSKAAPDTLKVNLLLNIGDSYQFDDNDPETAKAWYKKAGELSGQLHYHAGIFNYLFYYLDILVQQGQYDSSLRYSRQAIALAQQLKDTARMMQGNFTAGVSYDGLEDYTAAIPLLLQAADYYESRHNGKSAGLCYNEMQLAYRHLAQYANAIQYGKKAVDIYHQLHLGAQSVSPLSNLAGSYLAIYQPEKSLPLLKEALAISKTTHSGYNELTTTINLADAYFLMEHYDDSVKMLAGRALYLARTLGQKEYEAQSLYALATWVLHQTQLHKAGLYADSGLVIAKENNQKENRQTGYFLLSKKAYANHDYQKAAMMDREVDLVKEEIENDHINRSILALQMQFETTKKELRINQLETAQQVQQLALQKRKTVIFLLILLLAMVLLVGWLLLRNNRRRQALQHQQILQLQQEKQLSATEAVIKGQEEERVRMARDLHDGLGGILSGTRYLLGSMKEHIVTGEEHASTIDRTIGMLDHSIAELRRVAHNMMPESLLKLDLNDALQDYCQQITNSDALDITYQGFGLNDVETDHTVKITVYRIVQELINNIIKHASAKSAVVQVIVKDRELSIAVEDDGRGFDTAMLDSAKGIGYKNISNRVEFLKGKIDVSSEIGKGTSVYIQIPLQHD